MSKYCDGCITIEAFKYDGDLKDSYGNYCAPEWAEEAHKKGIIYFVNGDMFIKTPTYVTNEIRVNLNDYVGKEYNGNIIVWSPEVFEKRFIKVEE